MRLTVNMRLLTQANSISLREQKHVCDFADWLIQIGNGELNEETEMSLPLGMSSLTFKIQRLADN
jgi:hypothetical protein